MFDRPSVGESIVGMMPLRIRVSVMAESIIFVPFRETGEAVPVE